MPRKAFGLGSLIAAWVITLVGSVILADFASMAITGKPLPSGIGGFLMIGVLMVATGDIYRRIDQERNQRKIENMFSHRDNVE